MKTRSTYDPAAEICTETVQVNLPLRTKQAFAEIAKHRGETMSGLLRRSVVAQIARSGRVKLR